MLDSPLELLTRRCYWSAIWIDLSGKAIALHKAGSAYCGYDLADRTIYKIAYSEKISYWIVSVYASGIRNRSTICHINVLSNSNSLLRLTLVNDTSYLTSKGVSMIEISAPESKSIVSFSLFILPTAMTCLNHFPGV